MQSVVVIFCPTLGDAISAAEVIPVSSSYKRFFFFIGVDVYNENLTWLDASDLYFFLTGIESRDDWREIATRTAFLYSSADVMFFCLAECPPDIETIMTSLGLLEQRNNHGTGIIHRNTISGARREYVALHGFQVLNVAEENIVSVPEVDVLRAMQGNPVSEQAVLQALKEVLPLSNMWMHPAAKQGTSISSKFARSVMKLSKSQNAEQPATILLEDTATPDTFIEALKRIPANGAVLIVASLDRQEQFKSAVGKPPYREFRVTNGLVVSLYGTLRDGR